MPDIVNDLTTNQSNPLAEAESHFAKEIKGPLVQAMQTGERDIVVGIPFYNETESVAHVVETARQGLKTFYPDSKSIIIAAGSPVGEEALNAINALPEDRKIPRIAFLLNDDLLIGKGWEVRAIAEIADTLGADLIVLEADLKSRNEDGEIEGLAPDWVPLLLDPIRNGEADIVFSRFNRHPLEAPVSVLMGCPVLTAIYNFPIHRIIGSQWGISHGLIHNYLKSIEHLWTEEIGEYGINSSIATSAIVSNSRICEANLGIKIDRPSAAKRELVLRQVTNTLFARIMADKDWWKKKAANRQFPLVKPLANFGIIKPHHPVKTEIDYKQAITKYKDGFNKFHALYEGVFSPETYHHLEELTRSEDTDFDFNGDLWARIIYQMILAYTFGKRFARWDLIDSLVPLFNGFTANFAIHIYSLAKDLKSLPPKKREHLLSLESETKLEELIDDFQRQKQGFLNAWEQAAEESRPSVPQITYREFIPGVHLVVPIKMTSPQGKQVWANDIYNIVFTQNNCSDRRLIREIYS